jgi:hypothetical protein
MAELRDAIACDGLVEYVHRFESQRRGNALLE